MTGRFTIHHGDCLDILRGMPDCSVDSIVTDPPYGLKFMGQRWDYDVPSVEVWAECLRVLKPGGHLLAFAGTRTQHRMAVRIEDAGFEIRDMIAWLYGSGFPKSHNGPWGGTALKPAMEPITMARKPLIGTVAANVMKHGTGALNIDGCRVASEPMPPNTGAGGLPRRRVDEQRGAGVLVQPHNAGRWPANVIHDGSGEVLKAFPDAPGQMADASLDSSPRKNNNVYGALRRGRGDEPSANSENNGAVGFKMKPGARRFDQGSAARFFYCAKASKRDRDEGLCSEPDRVLARSDQAQANATRGIVVDAATGGFNHARIRKNHHPTVKPTDLMRYLCRLVTPPAGVVLDPFTGSGSTGKAALLEGFSFIGIELEADSVEIAKARLWHAARSVQAAQVELPLGLNAEGCKG